MTQINYREHNSPGKHRLRLDFLYFLITGVLTAAVLILHLQLWKAHPHIPIDYQGDGILTMSGFRNMELGNWYFRSRLLGYPYGQQLFDFPAISDGINLSLAWLGIRIGMSPAMVFNSLYLLSFILSSCLAFIGARILKLNHQVSALVGFLFAFLPFHFLQGPGHLFLSLYFSIPLWAAVIVRQLSPDPLVPPMPSLKNVGVLGYLRARSFLAMTSIGIISASCGIYFAAFMLLAAAFALAFTFVNIESKTSRSGIVIMIFSGLATLVFQALPVIHFQVNQGRNALSVSRTIHELEFYSLRIIDLFLPITQHRVDIFAAFSSRNISAYIPGEPTESLGLLGSLGFAYMLFAVLWNRRRNRLEDEILVTASLLSLFFILFATTGGISQLLAAIGITEIRVWSRVAIVLGFFSLISFGHLIMRLNDLLSYRLKKLFIPLLVCIGLVGFWDTNPSFDSNIYDQIAKDWNRDRHLINTIEQSISPNAAVFQFPITRFPENGPIENMADYQLMRGYLHSKTLCWSYGSMKGREGLWLDELTTLSTQKQLDVIQEKGFNAIWIELNGFADRGQQLISEISQKFGNPLIFEQTRGVVVFKIINSSTSNC